MRPQEIEALERRLLVGWEKCQQARTPEERERLESFWVGLLHTYEDAVTEQPWPQGHARPRETARR